MFSVSKDSSDLSNFLVFDGKSVYSIDDLPPNLRDEYVKEDNYYTEQDTLVSDILTINVSGFIAPFLPVGIFKKLPENMGNINSLNQLVFPKEDIEWYIGYYFNTDERYVLKEITYINRIGIQENLAKKCPQIHEFYIEYTYDGKEWFETKDGLFKAPKTDFLEKQTLVLDDSCEDIHAKGYRIRIKSWYDGQELNMLKGLLHLEFKLKPVDTIRLPYIKAEKDKVNCEYKYIHNINVNDLTLDDIIDKNYTGSMKTLSIDKKENLDVRIESLKTVFLTEYDVKKIFDFRNCKNIRIDLLLPNDESYTADIECDDDTRVFIDSTYNRGKLILHNDKKKFKIINNNLELEYLVITKNVAYLLEFKKEYILVNYY